MSTLVDKILKIHSEGGLDNIKMVNKINLDKDNLQYDVASGCPEYVCSTCSVSNLCEAQKRAYLSNFFDKNKPESRLYERDLADIKRNFSPLFRSNRTISYTDALMVYVGMVTNQV